MTGLEQITEQIKKEADMTAKEQLAKTKKDAEQILLDAKKECEASYAAAKEAADLSAEQILLRGQSAANLAEKKMLLAAKQQIIQQIFEDAVDTIQKLSSKDYFEFLLHMIDRYSLQAGGVIYLSREDLDRVPMTFRSEVVTRHIQIAEDPVQINGGFILSYGEIEQNCSLEALLASNREILSDQIVKLVFDA